MNFFKKNGILFIALIFLYLLIPQSASSEGMSNYELEQEIKALKEKIEKPGLLDGLSDKLTFSGAIELDYSYANDSDIGDNTVNDSTSDLDIGTVELGVEVAFHEYVTGNFILKGEALDTDNDRVFWDEAIITIQKEGFPIYFVGGKRGQPFGVFESHLINDPITKECYEIAKTGATIGFAPDFLGLDISATAYKGEVLADKLSEAGYGWARDPDPNPDPTDDIESYVFNVSLAPTEGLSLSAYFDSEPGQGSRNKTAGGTIKYQIGTFTFDAEYVAALKREKNATANKEYKESAWFTAIAFQIMDPLEIAARYEAFDDDMEGDQDGHLENRYSIGFTYTLFEKDTFATNLMGEYRISNYEKAAGSTADDKLNEIFLRLAIEF